MQTLLRCSSSPHVQSRAPTSVGTLKIPGIGRNTIVWTHENSAHTGVRVGMGSAGLVGAVALSCR